MKKNLIFAIIYFTFLFSCSKVYLHKNLSYNFPLKNSEIVETDKDKFSKGRNTFLSKIISYTDSLVYPVMSGTIVKTLNLNTKSIIIRHNDTLLSVYTNLNTIFVKKGDSIDIQTPIGIALKNINKWELKFAIWNRYFIMNTDSLLNSE